MIFTTRISSCIASLAAIFYLTAYHVDAHCFHPNGNAYHDHHHMIGCDPTVSPAPTESPAPSPSPSEVPTDTQGPSHSMLPSSSPTSAPTTSTPSSTPTDSPTESPAPSPSPSAVPSAFPTKSATPSMSPTDMPSEFPSQNPSNSPTTSSPSESPTAPISLTVVDLRFTIYNVTGEREMSQQNIEYFEKETTLYLQEQIREAPGVSKIEVETVIVKDQKMVFQDNSNNVFGGDSFLRNRRRLDVIQANLMITVDVVVSVLFDRSESLQLNMFFEEFFAVPEHALELKYILERSQSFSQELFSKSATSSSKASKKGSGGAAVTGAILGIVGLIVGSGLVWMWIKTRRGNGLQSNNSDKIENFGTESKSFKSGDRKLANSNVDSGSEIDDDSRGPKTNRSDISFHTKHDNDGNENDDQADVPNSQLMYVPTYMSTISNIEVPETPTGTLATNGLATPASARGFMTPASSARGFMTPASANSKRDGNNSVSTFSRFLGETSPDEDPLVKRSDEVIVKTKKPRNLLPPKFLSPLRSPFGLDLMSNRAANIDEQRCDASSLSREGVVGGERTKNVDSKSSRSKKISRDLPPMEIGGPRSVTSRRTSRTCPPMMIGGPLDPDPIIEIPKKAKDRSVVDIVDEIAYLYSTQSEPERYKDTHSMK